MGMCSQITDLLNQKRLHAYFHLLRSFMCKQLSIIVSITPLYKKMLSPKLSLTLATPQRSTITSTLGFFATYFQASFALEKSGQQSNRCLVVQQDEADEAGSPASSLLLGLTI